MSEGTIFELEGISYSILYKMKVNSDNYILVSYDEKGKILFDVFEVFDDDTVKKISDKELKNNILEKFMLKSLDHLENE